VPVAVDALDAWLSATPGEGRYLRRLAKLSALDASLTPR